jgi:hypothetical protein
MQGSGPPFTVSFNLKSVRGLLFMQMLTFAIFAGGYTAGYGETRYSVTRIEPIKFFEAWNFYLAILLPILNISFMFYFVTYIMSKARPTTFLIYPAVIIALAQTAWNIVMVGVNLPVWVDCNDGGLAAPAHPECINRHYPTETLPDWSFMIMVISSGGLAFSGVFSLLILWNANTSLSAEYNLDFVSSKLGKARKTGKIRRDTRAPKKDTRGLGEDSTL